VNYGTGTLSEILAVLNGATGPADLLSGLFSEGGSGFDLTGFNAFSDLVAQQASGDLGISLNTDQSGNFVETIDLQSAGSNDSGYSGALADVILTVEADVVPEPVSAVLLGVGLLGLAAVRRRRGAVMFMALSAAGLGVALALSASPAQATVIGYSGSVESYTAAVTGDYTILANGAQGGTGNSGLGGDGAQIGGNFFLTAGEALSIVVGGQGGTNGSSGGGGGGSFVYVTSGDTLLVASGGGGGAYGATAGGIGLTTPGGGSFFNNNGGTNGSGGGAGGAGTGGGGAGWLSSGGGGGRGGAGGGSSQPGWGGGGDGHNAGANGGFGGGGGGSNSGAGGGGGYSGGGATSSGTPGGGGGSYLDGGATDPIEYAGVNSGNGSVSIDLEGATPAPEPASFGIVGLGAAVLGLIRERRRRQTRSVVA